MSRFLSEKLMNVTPYTPGEQPQDQQYIKLNTNESPYPPSPAVLAAVPTRAAMLIPFRRNLSPDSVRLFPAALLSE